MSNVYKRLLNDFGNYKSYQEKLLEKAKEKIFWRNIQIRNTKEAYKEYLISYPNSRYSVKAKKQINKFIEIKKKKELEKIQYKKEQDRLLEIKKREEQERLNKKRRKEQEKLDKINGRNNKIIILVLIAIILDFLNLSYVFGFIISTILIIIFIFFIFMMSNQYGRYKDEFFPTYSFVSVVIRVLFIFLFKDLGHSYIYAIGFIMAEILMLFSFVLIFINEKEKRNN